MGDDRLISPLLLNIFLEHSRELRLAEEQYFFTDDSGNLRVLIGADDSSTLTFTARKAFVVDRCSFALEASDFSFRFVISVQVWLDDLA